MRLFCLRMMTSSFTINGMDETMTKKEDGMLRSTADAFEMRVTLTSNLHTAKKKMKDTGKASVGSWDMTQLLHHRSMRVGCTF